MIPGLAETPPIVAWLLGFFMGLALKRGRIETVLDQFLPAEFDDEQKKRN
jgi:hypothetical protein